MYKHWLLFKYANFATIKIHAVHYVSTDPDNNSKAEKNTTPTGIQLHDLKILNPPLLWLSYTAILMTEIKYWERLQN
mgnify:CR=1 FL=1